MTSAALQAIDAGVTVGTVSGLGLRRTCVRDGRGRPPGSTRAAQSSRALPVARDSSTSIDARGRGRSRALLVFQPTPERWPSAKGFPACRIGTPVNTIAATSRRVPRPALIGIAVLIAAFAALMLVRARRPRRLVGRIDSPPPHRRRRRGRPRPRTAPAQPRVVLLPGLPAQVASMRSATRASPSSRSTSARRRAIARGSPPPATALARRARASSPSTSATTRPRARHLRLPGR